MKKRIVYLLFFIAAGISSKAQKSFLGITAGLSIPELSGGNNEVSKGYTTRLAANFGVLYELGINKKYSFQAEINYAAQGGKRTGMQPITDLPPGYPANPYSDYYYADFKNVAILNYIEIPLLVKLYLDERQRVYVDLGPNTGFLVRAQTKTSGSSFVYLDKEGTMPASPSAVPFDATTDVKEDIKKLNFGLAGGGGLNFPIGRNLFFADIRVTYGITTIQKNPGRDGKSHAGNVVISAGYAFRLYK